MKRIYIIQNWATESAGIIVDYLKEKSLQYKTIHSYDNEPMPKVESLETVIVLGCPISVNNYQEHVFLMQLYDFMSGVVANGVPVLGICLGSQMLAMVLGAQVRKNPVREIGLSTVQLTEDGQMDNLFKGFKTSFPVFQWHNDTFEIPRGAKHLAESEHCINQAFRKGTAVGIQFHLEPRLEDIPHWCNEYAAELGEDGLSKEKIIVDFNNNYSQIRKLNFLLLDNFLNL